MISELLTQIESYVPANVLIWFAHPAGWSRRTRGALHRDRDVWHIDAGRDGSVLINLIVRPGDVVRFSPAGGQPVRLAHFAQAAGSQTVIALPDGRAVVSVNVSGRMRLMAVQDGRNPAPLVKTQEDTDGPMAAVAGNRIAFTIGREPRDTIAIADTTTGSIAGRISPGKGVIVSLAASEDGATLYFTAGGAVWSVAADGGDPRRTGPGDWVVPHPSGTLVVARNETSQIHLFEVPAAGGTERAIPLDPATRIYSMGTIGDAAGRHARPARARG